MTKQERLNLYNEALEVIKSGKTSHGCLCGVLYQIGTPLSTLPSGELPELFAQKPDVVLAGYWWPEYEWEPRIKALQEAIKLCEL